MNHVTAGARAFLGGLIDYAGLFPPAALALDPALAEYARHREEAQAWMLGRFIIPAGGLRAMTMALTADPALAGDRRWSLTVLGGGGPDLAAALAVLAMQADAVAECEQGGPGLLMVEGLEVPLPAGRGAAAALAAGLADEGLDGRDLFLEISAAAALDPALDDVAAAAADWSGRAGAFPKLGVKFRCGGVTAAAFPGPERVAGFIAGAAQRRLPMKFTAGLHHPVRAPAISPAVVMHGFLNVIGAALLAVDGRGDPGLLTACLEETEAAAFRLDDEGFAWREHRVEAATIARARDEHVAGFGSCSFDEPRLDLAALGLL